MSRENVELVRRWAANFEAGGFEGVEPALDSLLAPSAEWIEDPLWPGSATVRGRETIKTRVREYFESFDWSMPLEEVVDAGDDVVVIIHARGRGESSGLETAMQMAVVLTFEGRQVTRWRWFLNPAQALEAVSVPE